MQCIRTSEARPRRGTHRPCAGMHTLWKHTPYRWSGGNSEQETAASLGFCTCFAIVPVTAAVFHFAYFTSTTTSTHVQCIRGNRTPPLLVCYVSLTMSTAKLVPSRSVGFRTYLAIVTGGFCTCLAIVPVSAAVFHLRMLHCTGQGVQSQRSKIGPKLKISQINRYIGQIS